jgi:RNA polymerase sigma factor (sigma-70 family)
VVDPPDIVKGCTKDCGVSDRSQDLQLIYQALAGNENAGRDLQARYSAQLKATLCKRGASITEADDLVADLWADCFGSSGEPLLLKYEGRCPLSSWLITVVTHKLIDRKRLETLHRKLLRDKSGDSQSNDLEVIGNLPACQPDNDLIGLLRRAVMNAFAAESPEKVLILRLVHVYEVTQREVGRIWNWHESKVSRTLESARVRIRTAVLADLHLKDPPLELEWEDFLLLARCAPDLAFGVDRKIGMQDNTIYES